MRNQILLYAVALLFSGCAFVELSDEGALVKQGTAEDIVNCELVAEVSSQTKDKILIDRSDTSVRGELAILARNKAAEMGANVVVASTDPNGGAQSFKAYLCS